MAQQIFGKQKIEQEAWELFEVGSYDEVISISSQNTDNLPLLHLGLVARYERGDGNSHDYVDAVKKGESVFSPLISSYISKYLNNKNEALEHLMQYLKQKDKMLCYTIINYGVDLAYEVRAFKECLAIMNLLESKVDKSSFVVERLDCFYYLKMYKEMIQFFRENYKLVDNNYDIQVKAGLALFELGMYKESELLLKKVPNQKKLETFEEKFEIYRNMIKKIPQIEKKKAQLSQAELKELGFAYLFNSDYKKAEEVFKEIIATSTK